MTLSELISRAIDNQPGRIRGRKLFEYDTHAYNPHSPYGNRWETRLVDNGFELYHWDHKMAEVRRMMPSHNLYKYGVRWQPVYISMGFGSTTDISGLNELFMRLSIRWTAMASKKVSARIRCDGFSMWEELLRPCPVNFKEVVPR